MKSGTYNRTTLRRGFTLVEILAAMAILAIILLMLGNIFTQSHRIWKLGTKRSLGLGETRGVMEALNRVISQAIADSKITFKLRSNNDDPFPGYGCKWVYGWEVDELYLLTMVRTPWSDRQYRREAHSYVIFVTNMVDAAGNRIPNRFRLVQSRKTGAQYTTPYNLSISAYKTKTWWKEFGSQVSEGNLETLAENVAAFEIWAWSEKANRYVANYYSLDQDNKLPLWVDIWLEVLSEEEAIQLAALWAASPEAARLYLNQHTRRYASRVYLANRIGYVR